MKKFIYSQQLIVSDMIIVSFIAYVQRLVTVCLYVDGKAASASKPRKAPKTKKAIEMAAKVALMKLKQTATGDSGVPMESRVYVNVQLPAIDSKNLQAKYSAYWLDQVCTHCRY